MNTNIAVLYNKCAITFREFTDQIKKHVKKGNAVVDLGCGTGVYIKALQKQVGAEGRVICIDKNKEMVAYCKRKFSKGNIIVKKLAAEKLSSLGERADVVLASLVLQFTKVNKAIAEIRKTLKPGGKLIFTIPLYRAGISIGIDRESKAFKAEFDKNFKAELKKQGINCKPSFEYPNSRNKLFKQLLLKNSFKILEWRVLPIEKSRLNQLLDYYKVPWRSAKILNKPFKVRYKVIMSALKKAFRKYPRFRVIRYYLIAVATRK